MTGSTRDPRKGQRLALILALLLMGGLAVALAWNSTANPAPIAVRADLAGHQAIVARDRMIANVENIARRLDDMSQSDTGHTGEK